MRLDYCPAYSGFALRSCSTLRTSLATAFMRAGERSCCVSCSSTLWEVSLYKPTCVFLIILFFFSWLALPPSVCELDDFVDFVPNEKGETQDSISAQQQASLHVFPSSGRRLLLSYAPPRKTPPPPASALGSLFRYLHVTSCVMMTCYDSNSFSDDAFDVGLVL